MIGEPLIILESVDSTNNYAMAQWQAGAISHGTAVFAHMQTAGKGQRGRSWMTQPKENIILSIALSPPPGLAGRPFLLSVAIALGCYDFFAAHAGDETSLKWPNDIYWRDRKAGGILIENIFRQHHWQGAIAGMGININQTTFDNTTGRPVSLKQITGQTFDVQSLCEALCRCLESRYQQLQAGSHQSLMDAYNQVLFKNGQAVRLKKENAVFEATIQGVNMNGQLVVQNGLEQCYNVGEVEWVL